MHEKIDNPFAKVSRTYDFREEVMTFESQMNAIDRYFAYKRSASSIEADNCRLIQNLCLCLWSGCYIAPSILECATVTCDTMNSGFWTLWYLFRGEGKVEGRPSNKKLCDAYYCNEKMFIDLIEEYGAKGFLEAACTIGNFIPVPFGCNGPRGLGKTVDYWDLTLHCAYKWFELNRECGDSCSRVLKNILGGVSEDKQKVLMERYAKWLEGFGDWDGFIEKNFLQPFVYCPDGNIDGVEYTYHDSQISDAEWGETIFGPPKSFWKNHCETFLPKGTVMAEGTAIPSSKEDIIDFFCNASSAIEKRSQLMEKRLEKICRNGLIVAEGH